MGCLAELPLPFAELHCLSNFSFLRGASHPEELAETAAQLGYTALAITDECSLAGIVRAHVAAKAVGLKLIIGSEVQLLDGPKLVLLACNREGYGNLSQLITRGRRRATKGHYRLVKADLEHGLEHCLALLVSAETSGPTATHWVAERFPNRAWIAAELLGGANDAQKLNTLRTLSSSCGLPVVAMGDVHMHSRKRRALQDVLTAIRLGKPVSECGHALFPNAERSLRPLEELMEIYPAETLLETARIAQMCSFSLDELRYEYPGEIVPAGETPRTYLRKEVEAGLLRRYPEGIPQPVLKQIEHELALITELRYEPYFLTVYDIVRFARQRNILCQGRGSAANSAVCYALGITEIDPSRSHLLFERFISRERDEPPDIDVDFEHERREEVIQYLYIRYGRDRAALAATLITYRARSALRDVAKALGFELAQINRLTQSLAWWDEQSTLRGRLREAGFSTSSTAVVQLLKLVNLLIGFPRHLSQHVGGFVLSRGSLSKLVPIENASMQDRSVIQWSKDDLESLRLMKVDVLALGMLTAIRRTLDLVSTYRGRGFELSAIPKEDPGVYEMIQRADTIGVFQIESRAQMSMLPRLRPRNFYDLVIEIAIVRPGPIQGGMVHPYLRRRQGLEPIDYPSEEVKSVLHRTLGVPIFQEQVMQLAIVSAGFSPGEADQLRRDMAAWQRKGSLEKHREKLIEGMRKKGYTEEFSNRIYQQIRGFGEYGFPESHSASFALLAYDSAWLKRYEPAAFLAALLNSQPMGFYAPSQLVQDAQRHGVEIRSVDVCESHWESTLERGFHGEPAVRLGLSMIKGLSKSGADHIVEARRSRVFENIDDLAHRAVLNQRDLECLTGAGALHSLSSHRRSAYWQVTGIHTSPHLLRTACVTESMPTLRAPTKAENLVADYANLGLTLGPHPLAFLRSYLARQHNLTAAQLRIHPNGSFARVTGIVIGRQRPGTASGVIFLTLEDESGYINAIVWPRLFARQRRELLQSQLLTIFGTVECKDGVVHLVAKRLLDQSKLLGLLKTSSRDFH